MALTTKPPLNLCIVYCRFYQWTEQSMIPRFAGMTKQHPNVSSESTVCFIKYYTLTVLSSKYMVFDKKSIPIVA